MKSKPYHHGNLKQALLDAALDILEQQGLEQLSLRKVAKATGVSQTAPYSHFKDKAELIAAVANIGFKRLTQRMLQESAGLTNKKQRLRAIGTGYVLFALENNQLFKLMFGPKLTQYSGYPELQQNSKQSFSLVYDAIGEALAQQNVGPAEQLAATQGARALVHGLANLLIDQRIPLAETNRESIEKILNDSGDWLSRAFIE